MRKLVHFAVHLVLVTGWLGFVSGVSLYVLERTGLLKTLLEHEIGRRLGALGGDLAIEEAELRWFAMAVDLEGVTLGAGGDTLRLDEVRVTLAPLWRRDPLRVEARDGHLILSPAFLNGLRGLTYGADRERSFASSLAPSVPTVQIEDLHVDLLTDSWGELPLGRVDLFLRSGEFGPSLTGRLIPTLAARTAGPGEVYLEGRTIEAGRYEVRAQAIDLPLSTEWVPETTQLSETLPFAPTGVLSLDAKARLSTDTALPIEASVRVSIAEGALAIPDTEQSFDDIAIEVQAELAADDSAALFEPSAWTGQAEARGLWGAAPLTASLRTSDQRPDELARIELHVARMPLGAPMEDLLSVAPSLARIRSWLDVDGTAELTVGARLPSVVGMPLTELPVELAGEVAVDGDVRVAYLGPISRRGVRDIGFPLHTEGVTGRLVFAHAPTRLRPALVGLVNLQAVSQGGGHMRGSGTLASMPVDLPPYKPGYGRPDMDLLFEGQNVPVNAELEAAFAGLAGLLPPSELWERYNPVDGVVSGGAHLRRTADMLHDSGRVWVDLEGMGLTWSPLPVPMQSMQGRVEFRDDGRYGRGVSFAGSGKLRTVKSLAVAGRFQTATPEADSGGINIVEVDVERLALTGDDVRILGEVVEGVQSSLASFSARGFAHTSYRRTRPLPEADVATTIEVTAGDPVRLTPSTFPMATGDVRGRVLIGVVEPRVEISEDTESPEQDATAQAAEPDPIYTARVTPLVGTWGKDVQVAFLAEQGTGSASRTEVYGAGIDPSSKSLLGSLSAAVRGPGALSTDAFTLDGRLDFNGVIESAEAADNLEGAYRFHLRDNRLQATERLELSNLKGKLELEGGDTYGARLTATLGTTPVVLSGASFTRSDSGFRFQTRLDANDVPLDREHLQAFIDDDTLTPLIDDLELRGRVDIDNALLTIEGPPEGARSIEFAGSLRPRETFVRLGLPISVDSASVALERLSFQHGQMRAWAKIEDLEGRIADRNLGPADMLVTYVQPRLSIENVDARFEGGRVRPLGGQGGLGGSAFSIDLSPPFPFQLGMSVRDVELAGLLRGLFASNIATRGTLSCDLRLTGDTENLLDLSGTGSFDLLDSRLWSIPVFRALFNQLGLDDTAIFDDMHTNVRLRNGVLQTNDIEVHSPLLQLVGSGSIDMDGSLRHDLEVRYSILDYLGPFRRLIYTIQNGLVSVAIRGDVNRPRVLLRSPVTGLFLQPDESYRALPLPDLGPLPERF